MNFFYLLTFCCFTCSVMVSQEQEDTVTFADYTKKMFKSFDVNQDDKLTLKEVQEDKSLLLKFYDYDFDKNNFLILSEIQQHALVRFRKEYPNIISENKTSSIDSLLKVSESKYVKKARFEYEVLQPAEIIEKLDKNGNGKIERSEAKSVRSFNTDFSRIDVNGDEVVAKKELTKYFKKLK